jgi:hypothetical protein
VLGELVARPLPTSNVTVPAVFRTIEKAHPTLLIDEADTFLKENEELRGVLNSGHRKGTASVIRTVGDDHEPRQFSTWAPAAIAMIGQLPATLDDRAVRIRLRRRKPTEQVQSFRSDRADHLRELARKAARWTADHGAALGAADPDMGELVNRAADNWRPLFAIADVAGGEWPALARQVADHTESVRDEQSIKMMLLSDIRDIIRLRSGEDRIRTAELAALLGDIEGRPWAEWGRSGKPITAAGLARQLSPFGILSAAKRHGAEVFKGYLFADFEETFAAYLADAHTRDTADPPSQSVTALQRNNDGHCNAFESVTQKDDVTLAKTLHRNNHGDCNGVTVSQGGNGAARAHRRCDHCRGEDGETVEVHSDGVAVWLHRDCMDAWQAMDIPSYLRRALP